MHDIAIALSMLLAVLAVFGHVAAWTWLYNRLHASGLPQRLVRRLEKVVILAAFFSLAPPAAWIAKHQQRWLSIESGWQVAVVQLWLLTTLGMLAYVTVIRLLRQRRSDERGRLVTKPYRSTGRGI